MPHDPRGRRNANQSQPDFSALTLGIFLSLFFRQLLRFERLRQRRQLTVDVFEKDPLLGDFKHPDL